MSRSREQYKLAILNHTHFQLYVIAKIVIEGRSLLKGGVCYSHSLGVVAWVSSIEFKCAMLIRLLNSLSDKLKSVEIV